MLELEDDFLHREALWELGEPQFRATSVLRHLCLEKLVECLLVELSNLGKGDSLLLCLSVEGIMVASDNASWGLGSSGEPRAYCIDFAHLFI